MFGFLKKENPLPKVADWATVCPQRPLMAVYVGKVGTGFDRKSACRLRLHPATTACSRAFAAGLSATQCRRRFRHRAARRHPPRRARRRPRSVCATITCVGLAVALVDAADLRHRAHRSQHVDGKEPVPQEDQESVAGTDANALSRARARAASSLPDQRTSRLPEASQKASPSG